MRRLLLALSVSLAIGTPAFIARAGGAHGGGGHGGGGCWGGGYHGGYCGYGHGYYGHGGYCGYYGHGYGGYYGHGCYYGGWYPSFYFGVGFGYPAYGYYGYPAYGYAYAPAAYPTYSYYPAQPYATAPVTVSGGATTTVKPAPAAQTLIYTKPAPSPARQQSFTVASAKRTTTIPSAPSSEPVTGKTSTGKWVQDPNPYSYTPTTSLASAKTDNTSPAAYVVAR
jgi:hypothetical protein